MRIKENIISQYYASLEMLKQAIAQCPESLWLDPQYQNPFWHTAFHVLFYTHFYLGDSEENFVPWEKHKSAYVSLAPSEEVEGEEPYSKEDILAYHAFCWEQVQERVPALDLAAGSGFHWLPFDKLELQIYNIRHIQQHTGELFERLGSTTGIELNWVGKKPDMP